MRGWIGYRCLGKEASFTVVSTAMNWIWGLHSTAQERDAVFPVLPTSPHSHATNQQKFLHCSSQQQLPKIYYRNVFHYFPDFSLVNGRMNKKTPRDKSRSTNVLITQCEHTYCIVYSHLYSGTNTTGWTLHLLSHTAGWQLTADSWQLPQMFTTKTHPTSNQTRRQQTNFFLIFFFTKISNQRI
jgi:hypothetical protein